MVSAGLRLILGAALPLAVTACAETAGPASAAAEAGARQCFRPEQVSSFHAEEDNIVYLRVGTRRIYRAEIIGVCPDIDWTQRVAIRTTGSSGWICQGLDAELIVPGPLGLDRCPVTDVRRLSDAEAQAWRERH